MFLFHVAKTVTVVTVSQTLNTRCLKSLRRLDSLEVVHTTSSYFVNDGEPRLPGWEIVAV